MKWRGILWRMVERYDDVGEVENGGVERDPMEVSYGVEEEVGEGSKERDPIKVCNGERWRVLTHYGINFQLMKSKA